MAEKLFSHREDLTATLVVYPHRSQLLRIKDIKSGILFFVDSGAEISLIKPTFSELQIKDDN